MPLSGRDFLVHAATTGVLASLGRARPALAASATVAPDPFGPTWESLSRCEAPAWVRR